MSDDFPFAMSTDTDGTTTVRCDIDACDWTARLSVAHRDGADVRWHEDPRQLWAEHVRQAHPERINPSI